MRLTDVSIRQLPLADKGQKRIRDDTLPGFGLTVGTSKKTFFVMYGQGRTLRTLGHWPDISLKEARQAARVILAKPPRIQRSMGFSEARDAFLADCALRLRKSTVDRYFYALKDIRATTLDSVSTTVNDPTTLKALKSFYNWCIDHELTDRNPFLRRRVVFPVRERLLTDAEIVAIFNYDHTPYSDIVKLLILTGQRRNQIWKYQPHWRTGDTITFPSSIMKSNRPHTLPIVGSERYLPTEPFDFNSWSKAKVRLDKECGVTHWVLHDIRRYFSTTMARLGTPLHVTEQILDHRSQVTGVAAIYNLHTFLDEMRLAQKNYEAWLLNLLR